MGNIIEKRRQVLKVNRKEIEETKEVSRDPGRKDGIEKRWQGLEKGGQGIDEE